MTKLEAIAAAKTFRKDADELLQRMKKHRYFLSEEGVDDNLCAEDGGYDAVELLDQNQLSIHDLEACIMRQGMVLKCIGNPDPYPESRNPESPVVEPTADSLKL
jgi:hypothetical protein